jgi:hypothetical protein
MGQSYISAMVGNITDIADICTPIFEVVPVPYDLFIRAIRVTPGASAWVIRGCLGGLKTPPRPSRVNDRHCYFPIGVVRASVALAAAGTNRSQKGAAGSIASGPVGVSRPVAGSTR